jgi:ferredoxin
VTQGTSDQASTTQRLAVDSDICAGHGRCYTLQPELFEADGAGYPVVLHQIVPPALTGGAEDAVASCPEGAISLGGAG